MVDGLCVPAMFAKIHRMKEEKQEANQLPSLYDKKLKSQASWDLPLPALNTTLFEYSLPQFHG